MQTTVFPGPPIPPDSALAIIGKRYGAALELANRQQLIELMCTIALEIDCRNQLNSYPSSLIDAIDFENQPEYDLLTIAIAAAVRLRLFDANAQLPGLLEP